VFSQFGSPGWPSTTFCDEQISPLDHLMNTPKLFVSAVTAVAVAGTLSLAYAQTSTSPGTTSQTQSTDSTMQSQPAVSTDGTMNRNADGTLNNNSGMNNNNRMSTTESSGMATGRQAQADRN